MEKARVLDDSRCLIISSADQNNTGFRSAKNENEGNKILNEQNYFLKGIDALTRCWLRKPYTYEGFSQKHPNIAMKEKWLQNCAKNQRKILVQ